MVKQSPDGLMGYFLLIRAQSSENVLPYYEKDATSLLSLSLSVWQCVDSVPQRLTSQTHKPA